MDTDALRWLQQVTDGTTLTEVSELESVTQSGVSRALARLEAQIGTPLLRRSGRTLRMTHAGAVFKPHLDALLHNLDDGIAAVSQLIDPDTGRWRGTPLEQVGGLLTETARHLALWMTYAGRWGLSSPLFWGVGGVGLSAHSSHRVVTRTADTKVHVAPSHNGVTVFGEVMKIQPPRWHMPGSTTSTCVA